MTDSDAEMLASLTGFKPGPWSTDTGGEVHKYGSTVFAWPQWADQSNTEEIHSNMRLGAAAPDLHRIATEQAAEIARLQALLENAIDHHYAAMCVVRGNLDDSYKPMAKGMKSACNRWRSALPNSKMRSYYE